MSVGLVGLGRMGQAVLYRLQQAGHDVVAYDPNEQACAQARKVGAVVVDSIAAVAQKTSSIWVLVPAGDVVDTVMAALIRSAAAGTIVIDAGNSFFKKTQKRAVLLAQHQMHLLDCGTSGGIKGKEIGFSLMIGGDKEVFVQCEEQFAAVAMSQGYGHIGPSGAGHYVKMVHNGIEYSLLQAYAEGLQLVRRGPFDVDMSQLTGVWCHGSVIRSWICDLLHEIFQDNPNFDAISGAIGENSTGRWTLAEAEERGISMPLLAQALAIRTWSRETGGDYATKVVALLRKKFGGHTLLDTREQ